MNTQYLHNEAIAAEVNKQEGEAIYTGSGIAIEVRPSMAQSIILTTSKCNDRAATWLAKSINNTEHWVYIQRSYQPSIFL